MIRRLFHPLDRYVFAEFTKIFVATALGFPILLTVIDLTDNLDKYLSRNLPKQDIALSYLYALPESMYLVLPAAVLFACVFTIGALTRHSEITAAKASGISFHRLAVPIFFASVLTAGLALVLSELAPVSNRRVVELRQEATFAIGTERYNFAFGAEEGRVYKIQQLQTSTGSAEAIQIERRGLEGPRRERLVDPLQLEVPGVRHVDLPQRAVPPAVVCAVVRQPVLRLTRRVVQTRGRYLRLGGRRYQHESGKNERGASHSHLRASTRRETLRRAALLRLQREKIGQQVGQFRWRQLFLI